MKHIWPIAAIYGCFALGAACFLAFVYLRVWVITNDAFDPMREVSIDVLLAAVPCFLGGSAAASCMRG